MPHEYFWGGGMWVFPFFAIIFGFTIMLLFFLLFFGKGFRPPCQDRKIILGREKKQNQP